MPQAHGCHGTKGVPHGAAEQLHDTRPRKSVDGTTQALVACCMTNCHTNGMAKAISVRLDDDAERALRVLEASGLTVSEAIRSSLLASAERLNRRRLLAAEAAALEADEADRREMLSVASLMESLRAAR